MKFIKFCEDYGIRYWLGGSKYCSRSMIQFDCPFCDNKKGPHCGFNKKKYYFNCWSCGWNSTPKVIMALLDCNFEKSQRIIKKYRGKELDLYIPDDTDRPTSCKMPGNDKWQKIHKDYLTNRGFNWEELKDIRGLKVTHAAGSYKFRIMSPIYYRNRLVSYQGRDVTDKSMLRWKACPKDLEVIPHQDILYGLGDCPVESAILVEGQSDVWKMGLGAICGFGMNLSKSQVRLLKKFKKLFIIFDSEPRAQEISVELAKYLATTGLRAYNIQLDQGKDPGSLEQKEIRCIKKELLGIV